MNVSLIETSSRAAFWHWKPEYPARVALLRDAIKRAVYFMAFDLKLIFFYKFKGSEHNFYISLTTQCGKALHFPEHENVCTIASNLFFHISLWTYVYTHTISSSSSSYYYYYYFYCYTCLISRLLVHFTWVGSPTHPARQLDPNSIR